MAKKTEPDLFQDQTGLVPQATTAVAIVDEAPPPALARDYVTPVVTMIQTAIDKGIDPEALGKLLDLQDRVLAKQAEAEFAEAKRAFQAECPVIGKNRVARIKKKGTDEIQHEYGFADLAHVAETIKPLCDKYGFSYSFNQKTEGGMVAIECVVRHSAGHKESTTFTLPSDSASPLMSSQQKYAGATTFGRRYALVLAFGLSIGEDNDGREKPEHENPNQRPDAPEVGTREQRSSPVTKDDLAKLISEWQTWNNGADRAAFAAWAKSVCGDGWNPTALGQWSRDKLNACWKANNDALGVPNE